MEMNTTFNYYEILDLSPQCNQNEITEAYEKAKATYSFDNPALYTIFTDQEAREYLGLIEEAYSVLGNRTLRSVYDEKIAGSQKDKIEVTFETLVEQSRSNRHLNLVKAPRFKLTFTPDPEFEKSILAETQWTGEFLKKVREYKNVSLETMSEVTKITAFYLRALEGMEPANLPAPVFVRGYIVQIARVLGLDDKKVADAYMIAFRARLGSQSR